MLINICMVQKMRHKLPYRKTYLNRLLTIGEVFQLHLVICGRERFTYDANVARKARGLPPSKFIEPEPEPLPKRAYLKVGHR